MVIIKMSAGERRHPFWLKVRLPAGDCVANVRDLIGRYRLHTVCRSARCPNIGECWAGGSVTFMILGDVCTRNCRFCAVKRGVPLQPDPTEPQRVAKAVKELGLRYVVITSVTRDDLDDGGAEIFAHTVRAIKTLSPECKVETLIPDFQGSASALRRVVNSGVDVVSHNIETVPRLYCQVRPEARYSRSLQLLQRAKEWGMTTKSGLMLGLGEKWSEIIQVMTDLRAVGCDVLTLGQYLQPAQGKTPVKRFYTPEEFDLLKKEGMRLGFEDVHSGPLVRSSYRAAERFFS